MPIFEYRCAACGRDFEQLFLKASPSPRCPSCGSEDVEKLLSLPSVSSEQTRKRATRDIRTRNRSTRREQADAEVRRIEAHSQDHDD